MVAKIKLPTLYKGYTYSHTIYWYQPDGVTPVEGMEDMDFKLQVREEASSAVVLLECSVTNGRLLITPASGKIVISITDEVTDTLLKDGGVYDLKVYMPDGREIPLIEGFWPFKQGVTRDD